MDDEAWDQPQTRQPHPIGRPTLYVPDIVDAFLAELMDGRSVRSICADPEMPSRRTILHWLDRHPDFLRQYKLAYDLGTDAIFEEALEIADTPKLGRVRKIIAKVEEGPEGEEGDPTDVKVVEEREEDMLGHRTLQVRTRQWTCKVRNPRKYGDRVQVAGDGEAPLEHKHVHRVELVAVHPKARPDDHPLG